MTWTTYDAVNPVILDPPTAYSDQSLNFRDPYIFWHKPTKKWIAVLSLPVLHKLLIYTSKDLKDWAVASEFGPVNAVDGAWECPNLFPLPVDGNDANVKWVVMVGLNPGGPPGTIGSGTQYVVGNFDGTTFIADTDSISVDQTSFSNSSAPSQVANWVDWGPDFYAAQVYNGLPSDEHVAIGWMNNWQYASLIPTDPWCGAMSTPRKFSLKRINGKATLVQDPTENWGSLVSHKGLDQSWSSVTGGTKSLGDVGKALQVELSFSDRAPAVSGSSQFGIIVRATPDLKEQTRVGYDFSTKRLFIDRTQSGNVSFDDTFADTYYAPLAADAKGKINMRIYVDWSSVEVFGGQGETTITAQIFPSNNATYAQIFSVGGDTQHVKVGINQVSSAWAIR
jgi:Beta-fructosidases (levanase/invertase)